MRSISERISTKGLFQEIKENLEVILIKFFLILVSFLAGLGYGFAVWFKLKDYFSNYIAISAGSGIAALVTFLLLRWLLKDLKEEFYKKNAD